MLLPFLRLGAALLLPGAIPSHGIELQEPIPGSALYVCVQDDAEIAVVDMERLEVVRRIRLTDHGFGPNASPHAVAVSDSHAYVSLIGEHTVVAFDSGDRLSGSFAMETPGMVGLTPSSDRILVSRSMSATDPPRTLGLGTTEPLSLDFLDVLFPRPHAVAVGPGDRAYTASLATNQLAAVDLASEEVELIDLTGPPHAIVQLAVSPDGSTLVGSGELSGLLVVLRLDDSGVPRELTTVPVGDQPFDPVFSSDGTEVWVPIKGTGEVVVVETSEWTVRSRISSPDLQRPHAIEFSPDGRRAFVTNNGRSADGSASQMSHVEGSLARLVVIDTRTHEIETSLELGRNLTGMGRQRAQ